jgi:hypothetical protein
MYDLDSGSGAVALDTSGNGYNGSVVGAVTWITGQSGSALQFDGNSGYVDVPSVPAMNFGPNDSFTLTAWVRSSPGYNLTKRLLGKQSSSFNTPGFGLWNLNTATSRLFARLVDTDGDTTGWLANDNGPFINDGNWHHVVLVVNRATQTLILHTDGIASPVYDLTAMGANGLGNLGNSVPFNLAGPSAWFRYGGAVDQVRLYAAALTQAQVLADYAGNVPGSESVVSVASLAAAMPLPSPSPFRIEANLRNELIEITIPGEFVLERRVYILESSSAPNEPSIAVELYAPDAREAGSAHIFRRKLEGNAGFFRVRVK